MQQLSSDSNPLQGTAPSASEATSAQRRVNAIVGEGSLIKRAITPTFGEVVIAVHSSRSGCEISCSRGGVKDQKMNFQVYLDDTPFFADSIMSQGCIPADNAAVLSRVLDEVAAAG